MKHRAHFSLMALCLGFFMVIMDVNIVNVALPNIAHALRGSLAGLQWVVDGYNLMFACLLLSAGSLGDRVGAKAAFLWGFIIFVLTSAGCGLAPSLTWLVIFRFFQGASAALLVPTSLALINASYESQEERSRAIGIWASVAGMAAALGPPLGGMLTAWFGWPAVFMVNVPVGLIGIFLTLRYVRNPVSKKSGGFDLPGQIMGILALGLLAFSLIQAGKTGWLSSSVLISFMIFVLSFAIFLAIEYRSPCPMLSLKLFRSPTFSAMVFLGMILNAALFGMIFILSFYFQDLRHYSVMMTGLALLPLPALVPLSAFISGRVVAVRGPRLPLLMGLAGGVLGYAGLLITGATTPHFIFLVLPLAAIGFGVSFSIPAASVAVITSAPEGRAGIASGAFNAGRQVGSLIGVAVFGTIISTSSHFMSGMHLCLIISSLLYLSGFLAVFCCVRP